MFSPFNPYLVKKYAGGTYLINKLLIEKQLDINVARREFLKEYSRLVTWYSPFYLKSDFSTSGVNF